MNKSLEDKLLEDELNGNTPSKPQFLGTGTPGKVSSGVAWGEGYSGHTEGDFGRQLALEYEKQKEMENLSNTYF